MASLLINLPVVLHPHAHLGGAPLGDRGTNLWNLWWVYYALFELGQSPLDCGFVFTPWGCDLRFHTLSLLNGVLVSPVTAVLGPVVAYNLLFLLHTALTLLFAARWAFGFGLDSRAAAWLGLLAAFGPYRFAHLEHINLFSTSTLFLSFWMMDETLRRREWQWIAGLTLAWMATALIDWYYGLFVGVYIGVHLVLLTWKSRRAWNELLVLLRYGIPVGGMLLLVCVYFWRIPVPGRPEIEPESIGMKVAAYWSNDLLQVFLPNRILSALSLPVFTDAEFRIHPGLLVMVLAVAGWMCSRWLSGRKRLLLVAGVFLLISMGPVLIVGGEIILLPNGLLVFLPAALYSVLPVLDSMRVFTRFAYPGFCILMVFAGAFLQDRFSHAGRWRVPAYGLVAVLILVETGFRFPAMVSYTPPESLHTVPDGPVVSLPMEPSPWVGLHMYHQTVHGQPIRIAEFSRMGAYRDAYLQQWPELQRWNRQSDEAIRQRRFRFLFTDILCRSRSGTATTVLVIDPAPLAQSQIFTDEACALRMMTLPLSMEGMNRPVGPDPLQ